MARMLKPRSKYRKRADGPALNVLKRHAETARDRPLSRVLNDLQTFQAGINDAIVKGMARDYIESLVGKGIEKVNKNYRMAMAEERAEAEATIAQVESAYHELQRLSTDDSRKATLALLNFEASKAKYAGKSATELRQAVDEYGRNPVSEPGELDLLSMELLKRGMDSEHTLLRRLMKENKSNEPWLKDVNAKAATEKIRLIDGIPEGMVRVKVGEHENSTMGWQIQDLISVNFDLSARKWNEDSQGEA